MAEEKKIDETIPGGRYIVGEKAVDAFGNEIKDEKKESGKSKSDEK